MTLSFRRYADRTFLTFAVLRPSLSDCASVDLSTEENCGDINSVASVLKSWFRDLPEPLLTRKLYPEFIKAVGIEDPAVQLMTLHEVTNQLPDPNYATLKFLMCHLHR